MHFYSKSIGFIERSLKSTLLYHFSEYYLVFYTRLTVQTMTPACLSMKEILIMAKNTRLMPQCSHKQ